MVEMNIKPVLLLPLLMMLITSEIINPVIPPTREIPISETESNKVHLWSTTTSPEVKQTTTTLQTSTHTATASSSHFTDLLVSPLVEEQFRSENFPHFYDTVPTYQYPVYPQNPEQSVGPTTKHFVVVSFIGLLLLFAIIQNTILATKRKEGLLDVSSRRKRDLIESRDLLLTTSEQEYILNDDARLRCIQRTICSENRKLFKDLGVVGKIVAKYLMRSIKESLDETPGWNRLVKDAGAAGLRGEDCDVLYRDCTLSSSLYLPNKSKIRQSKSRKKQFQKD